MLFRRIETKEEASALIQELNARNEPVVLDTETTGLDRRKDTLISAQLCVAGEEEAYYLEEPCLPALAKLKAPLILHNFKFDYVMILTGLGIDLRQGPAWMRDTMLMHHLLDENAEHGLDAIVQEKYGDNYKEVFWSRNTSFQSAPEAEQTDYACRDVVYTGKLYNEMVSALALSGVPGTLVDHVHKLALALYDTEVHGVRVDLDYLAKVGGELKGKIDTAIPRMRAAASEAIELIEADAWLALIDKYKTPAKKASVKKPDFNWNSTKQLQRLIYDELGLPVQMKWDPKKKERRPTLDDDALEELEGLHPVVDELRSHRGDVKVYGSFIEGTLDRQVGGRIYPSFNVNGTVTGRISSSNPNLQQLPREGGVRGIYVPSPSHKLISCDYGMLEVVVAAHYSQDPALLRIIHEGASKHDITAAALGIERQIAKTVNFAMQYQCSPFKVAAILGCSKHEGQVAWNKYWEAYAGESKVVNECKAKVDAGEPIVSIFGRQRRFPKVFASDKERGRAHRQAYSSLIQGTGADITHRAFYEIADYLGRTGIGRAVFEVHDEILIEVKDEHVEEGVSVLRQVMVETGVKAGLSVPLTVECSEPLVRWTK